MPFHIDVSRPQSHKAETTHVENFDDWAKVMSSRFVPLTLTATNKTEPFTGTVTSRAFTGIHLSHVHSDGHVVDRLSRLIDPRESRYIKLSLLIKGQCTITQDGRTSVIGPGDLVIYDTSRPYRISFGDDSQSFVVMMAPEMLKLTRPSIEQLTAVRMTPDSPVAICANPFMQQFAEQFHEVDFHHGAKLMKTFVDLLDLILHAELANLTDPSEDTELEEIYDYIREHLDDPDLSSTSIAKARFISVRRLQLLFQQQGTTVTAWIRQQRLEICKVELADPANRDDTISAIGARWGFPVPAHFNRLFKEAFGMPPGEWRRMNADIAA